MSIISLLNAQFKMPNQIVGRLIDIGGINSEGFTKFYLNLEIPNAKGNKKATVHISRTLLNKRYKILGLDFSAYEQLIKEGYLPEKTKTNIKLSAIRLRVTADPTAISSIYSNPIDATNIDAEPDSDIREPDEIYNESTDSVDWPMGEIPPRFCPVPIPDQDFYPGSSKTRLGYAVFENPINYIEHTRHSNFVQTASLRQQGTLKKGLGQAYETFTINYLANGPEEIETSVRDVFEQISLTPFITAEGGPFGTQGEVGDIPYRELAVRNFSISTVPGLPNSVQVEIAFDPFDWQFYCPVQNGVFPRHCLDDMICWPLFKLWAKTRQRSRYTGRKFTGTLAFSFPDPEAVMELESFANSTNYPSVADDLSALLTLQALLEDRKNATSVRSRNTKEIHHPNTLENKTRYFVVKFTNKSLFEKLINESDFFAGLVEWNKLQAANFVDDSGRFLPSSADVSADYITQAFTSGKPLQLEARASGRIYDGITVADIKRPGNGYATINDQIRTWGTGKGLSEAQITQHQLNPNHYFGVLLRTDSHTTIESLRTTVANLIEKNRKEAHFKYDNLSTRINTLFQDMEVQTVVLDSGPDGVDSDVLIERISGSRGHNLALMSQRGSPLPLHSYLGGMDATFVIEGKCFGFDAKKKLEQLKAEYDTRAIFTKSRKFDLSDVKKHNEAFSAFLRIENEIFQLMGVDFVVPITLSFQSIDGQPGVWAFTMSLLELDIKQKQAEQMQFLPTNWNSIGRFYEYGFSSGDNNPILDRALEYFSLQAALSNEETYPDMKLPSRGELDFWISAIGRYARDETLSQEEKMVVSQVKEFFPRYKKRIASHFMGIEVLNVSEESKASVDPDFYCYYDHNEAFNTVFDALNERLLGKREGHQAKGRASSNVDPTQKFTAPFRIHDPNLGGITSVTDHEFWGVNYKSNVDLEEQINNTYTNTFSKEVADKAKAKVEAANDKMDKTPGAWWTKLPQKFLFINPDGKAVDTSTNPEYHKRLFGGKVPDLMNPEEFKSQAEDPDSVKATNDTARYFDLGWRQEQVIKVATLLHPVQISSKTLKSFTINDDFWADNSASLIFDPDTQFVWVKNDVTLKDIEKAIEASIVHTFKKEDKGRDEAYFKILDTVSPLRLSGTYPYLYSFNFLCKTALINASQREEKTLATLKYVKGSDAVDSIIVNWELTEAIAKDRIDANLLRAVFLRRDGWGQFATAGSEDQGFGDFDAKFTGHTKYDGEGAKRTLDLFAKRYQQHMMNLSQVPSLALLATNMEMVRAARVEYLDKDGAIRKEIYDDLKKAASAIDANRYTEGSGTLISQTLRKYWFAGNVVDQYYTGYIETCRVFGSLFSDTNKYDAFFFPLNPLIVMDIKDDANLLSKFTPTGSEVNISSSRTKLNVLPNDLKDSSFDLESNSLEIAAEQAVKQRAAMLPHTEAAIYGSLHDMRKYSVEGKFLKAFPTFQIVLINEGFYWASGNKKLWDQFYTRTGVSSIEIHRSREMPGGTCAITFSNMFHNIASYAQQEAMAHQMAVANDKRMGELAKNIWNPAYTFSKIGEIFNDLITKNVPQDVIKAWQNCHLRRIALGAGTRVQVRMGYGSNAASLPIVFNGNVVDAPVTDGYVTLTAVADGHELEKPSTTKLVKSGNAFAFNDGGIIGSGKDPSSIVTEALVGATLWDNVFQGNFRDMSAGVAHFGEVYFEGTKHYPAEVQINLYSSHRSKLEQGVSAIDNYNIFNAIVNWKNDLNRFTVEVQEPTPWKVIEVCRRACEDFVAGSEIFANRSTVFFGKWWWPYHYAYHERIVKLDSLNSFQGAGFNRATSNTNTNTDGTKTEPKIIKHKYKQDVVDKIPQELLGEYISYMRAKKVPTNPLLLISDYLIKEKEVVLTIPMVPGGSTAPSMSSLGSDIYMIALKNGRTLQYTKEGNTYKLIREVPTAEVAQETAKEQAAPPTPFVGVVRNPFYSRVTGKSILDPLERPAPFLKDVEKLVTYLKWKPYMQAWIAHSGINLLDNNIRADSSKVYTDAVGLHLYNGYVSGDSVTKTITYSVDTDIHPADRKTMLVDTGIMLTGLQAGTDAIAGGVGSFIPFIGEYIEESPTTPAIENAVVSALVDSVKEMYQGWFTIVGSPTVKPRDLFLLTDHVLDLKGPVFVKEVIQRMDAQVGFITMVSPDAVVFPHSSIVGQQIVTSLVAGPLTRIGGYWIAKMAAVGLAASIRGIYDKKVAILEGEDLYRYNRLADIHQENISSVTKNIKNAMKTDLEKQLDTLLAQDSSAYTGKFKDEYFRKISLLTKQIDLIDRLQMSNSTDDYVKLMRYAKVHNLKIPDNVFGVGQELIAKQRLFEAELAIEKERMLFDIQSNKLDELLDEDVYKAIDRLQNAKRSAWVASHKNEMVDLISATVPDLDGAKIQKELLDLMEQRKALKANPTELAKIEKQIAHLNGEIQRAIDAGIISHSELDKALRLIMSNPATIWYDGVWANTLKKVWNSATATPAALIRGVLGTTGSREGAFNVIKASVPGSFGDKEVIAKAPSSKFKMATELYQQFKDWTKEENEAEQLRRGQVLGKDLKRIAKLRLMKTMRTARAIGTGVRLLKYMGPQAIVSVAIDTTVMILGGSIIEGHKARLRARQAVKIIPIMAGEIPYTAGIKGHQGAVIGDSASWSDELVEGIHEWPILGFAAAMMGVEVPEYGSNDLDQKYLEDIRKK